MIEKGCEGMRTTVVICDECSEPINDREDSYCSVIINWANPFDPAGSRTLDYHAEHVPTWAGEQPSPEPEPMSVGELPPPPD